MVLTEEKSLAEAFDAIGFGFFQVRLLIIAGLGFMADSIEVGVVTFLEQKALQEWPEVQGWSKNALSMSVFGTKLLGSCFWGSLSDHLGRRRAFLLANVFLLTTGCLSALAPSYVWLVVARGLVGLAIGGIVIPFDNLAESVPEKYSGSVCYAIEYFWTLGSLYSNGLAALVLEPLGWRIYLLLTALPILLACLGYFFLEESPMWLLDRGFDEEALEVLRRIGAVNGKDLSQMTLVSYAREVDPSCKEVLAPELRRPLWSLGIIWCLGLFGYYGAALANGLLFTSASGTVDYGETLFTSSGEIVGITCAMLASWYVSSAVLQPWLYLVSCLACLGILAVHSAGSNVTVLGLLAFLARCGSMGGVSVTWVLTPAAFPTHIRSTAHSVLYLAGSVGALLATAWPSSTSLVVMMAAYAGANLICTAVAQWQIQRLAERSFDSLVSDLHASDVERRARSSLGRESRASYSTWAARPSMMSRPSLPERH
ncbi:unnamed protein product [Effrenium voratum]|nr:unnamed protein product [Effrenium voratum]